MQTRVGPNIQKGYNFRKFKTATYSDSNREISWIIKPSKSSLRNSQNIRDHAQKKQNRLMDGDGKRERDLVVNAAENESGRKT